MLFSRVFQLLSNNSRSACCAVGMIVALMVEVSGLGEILDLQLTSLLFQKVGTRFKPSPEIVLLVIDDISLQTTKSKMGYESWSHSHLAQLIQACENAASVGMDIILIEPDRAHPEDDVSLAAALRRHGRVALAGVFQDYRSWNPATTPPAALQHSLVPFPKENTNIPVKKMLPQLLMPMPMFSEAAKRMGHINFFPAKDHLLRTCPYFIATDRGLLPSLTMATLMAAPPQAMLPHSRISKFPWKLTSRSQELIFYQEPFVRYSAVEVLKLRNAHSQTDWISGKVVLIGMETSSSPNTMATPTSGHQSILDVHATALSNWLQQTWLYSPPPEVGWVLACLFGLFPALLWNKPIRQTWISGGLLLAAYGTMTGAAFYLIPLRLPCAGPLLAFVATATYRLGDAFLRERASRRRLEELQHMQQLLGNMLLHDLNAPLNNMIMLLESILPEQQVGLKTRQRLETALTEGSRLSNLLHTLLNIQRMESGRMQLVSHRFRWDTLMNETVERLAPQLVKHHLTIQPSHDVSTIELYGDIVVLGRVLMNLFDNALQHATTDSIILCKTFLHHPQKEWLTCHVINHGPLLDPGDQKKIFEPFVQIRKPGRTQEKKGFGLGIAFCKLAITAHGGFMKCTSPAPGWSDGVDFEFSIPTNIQTAVRSAPHASP